MTTIAEANRMDRDELVRRHRKMIRKFERENMIDMDEEDPKRVAVQDQIDLLSKAADDWVERRMDT